MKSQSEIRGGLKVVFPSSDVEDITFDKKSIEVVVKLYDTFKFQDMVKLAELFGTEHLDFGNETRSGGYCDTCAYEYSVLVITATYDA